jgi:hypothetical protein
MQKAIPNPKSKLCWNQNLDATQNSKLYKLGCAVVSSSILAAVFIGLGGTSASAQITIQSTGTLSATILEMTNSPLARITIKVPATATLLTRTPTTGGSTPTPPPIVGDGSAMTIAPIVGDGSAMTIAPIVGDGSVMNIAPIVGDGSAIAPSTRTTYTSGANSPSLSTTPNMELSNSNSVEVNQVVGNPETLAKAACSQDYAKSCRIPTSPKQAIGPRSRVLLH